MANENATLTEKRELEITVAAVKEYYERKYKLYKANNDMPVTDEEFEELRKKALEVREIKIVLDDFEGQLNEALKAEDAKKATDEAGGK